MAVKKIKRDNIPVHANELRDNSGIRIKRLETLTGMPTHPQAGRMLEAHRDDHFIFIIQKAGSSKLMLDFAEVELKGPMLFFILPGQVHNYVDLRGYSGWFLAVESELIGDRFVPVFEEQRFGCQAVTVKDYHLLTLSLELLDTYLKAVAVPQRAPAVLQSMIQSVTGLIAGLYTDGSSAQNRLSGSQAAQLPARFRKLVAKHYITEKSPAAYADKLNLSLSYLNELVKKTTGFSVSYWIREQVLLESKRLLCYTTLDVKEIAYRIGYDDQAYFSRLFKKSVGRTPLDFRRGYRVLSNDPA